MEGCFVNLGAVLIFALAAPAPVPKSTPAPLRVRAAHAPDPCGERDSGLLATLDRPTIGYSSCAVKPKNTVIELGYSEETVSGAAPAANATYPQGFLRYGLRPNVELDFIGPAYGVTRLGATTTRGWFDSGVGAKFELAHNARSALAVDLLYTAPTGDRTFTLGAPSETVNFDASLALSPAVGVATTIGVTSTAGKSLNGNSARFDAVLPSVVVTDEFDPRTQLYLEAYGTTELRPDGGSRFALDGGVQYLLTPSFEVDLEAGRTVTDLTRSDYVGFGFGIRLAPRDRPRRY